MRFGPECIENEHAQLDARNIGMDWREDRVDRDLGLSSQLPVPECIEVVGTRCREADLCRRDGCAHGVESVVAARVAAYVTGIGHRRVRLDRYVDHLGLVASDFYFVLAGREIE